MRKITIEEWQHIPAGETISNGYAVDGDITAPSEPGFYTLYELATDNNTHISFKWEKE